MQNKAAESGQPLQGSRHIEVGADRRHAQGAQLVALLLGADGGIDAVTADQPREGATRDVAAADDEQALHLRILAENNSHAPFMAHPTA